MTQKARNETKWWGAKGRETNRPSILNLVKSSTLDVEMAAVLWLLMERKGSVVVASEAPQVGKTTFLSALLDLMPPWYNAVYVYGKDADLGPLKENKPGSSYILAPELGPDSAAHVWGKSVVSIFKAMDKGFSLGTTFRADSPEEVFTTLQGKPASVPQKLLGNVHAIVNLRLVQGVRSVNRRVCQLTLTSHAEKGDGWRLVTLTGWEPDSDSHIHMKSSETRSALAARMEMDGDELEEDLTARQRRLRAWLDIGLTGTEDLRKAITKHYRSRE
ncbi:MAG: hypothetical protein FJ317_00010 [SAR202 cluster bacterium]|nr:hypothetical protein [SAR202 cluster bacterium]